MDPARPFRPLLWVALLALALGAVVLVLETGSAPPAPAPPPAALPAPHAAAPARPAQDPAPEEDTPAVLLRGTVVEAGTPVPVVGAWIRRGTGAEARTDVRGRFALPGAPPGMGRLTAGADGYLGTEVDAAEGVVIRLERTTLLKVRALAKDGRPVAGARMQLSPPVPPRAETADAQGEWRVTGMKPGRYQVMARSPDGEQAGVAEVALAPLQHLSVTVTLGAAAAVEGQVLEAGGTAAGGARVWAATPDGAVVASGAAGADGNYLLRGIPAVDDVQIHAVKGGRHGASELLRPALGGMKRGVVVTLDKGGGSLAGTVIDDDGMPVSGASVDLAPEYAPEASAWASTVSDVDGRFSFEDVADQRYDVTARLGDLDAVADGVRPGNRNLTLVLASRLMLEGRAVDEAGSPVARFHVKAEFSRDLGARDGPKVRRGGSRATDVDNPAGTFSVGPVRRGAYELELTTDDGRLGRVAAEIPGRKTVNVGDVILRAGGRVVGRVVDKRSGMPVAGAAVGRGTVGVEVALSGADGRFSLLVPAGNVALTVLHPAYFPKRVPAGNVEARVPLDVGDILVVPGSRKEIEGRSGFGGVGAVLREDNGKVVIDKLLGEGPGTRAGLRQGDVVLAVDGEEASARGVQEAVSNLRGESGSTVWIKVRRGDQVVEVPVRREPISFDGR